MTTEVHTSAPFASNSWDDGEEWDQPLVSPAGPRNPATTAAAWDDASERGRHSGFLAKLWIGLFLVYTAAAVPLLVWALASIAA